MAHEIVPTQVRVPEQGVRLLGGILKQAFENNIGYLKSLSMDSTLYWFRIKAGMQAPGEPYRGHFEDNIKGQTAGLILMGAANSLRWQDDAELRMRVEQIVDCIEGSAETDGFFEPIPKSEFGTKEYPNYVRVWLNYGLKAASRIGSAKALALMRGMQTWFNQCDERIIAKDLMLGFQGVIANTTVYLSEVGKPEDLQTTIDYYQENWWLAQFIRGDEGAIHKRPTPHGTELEALTAYMDLYLATGKSLYLNAVKAAYRMFQDSWQHTGGGIVAIENTNITPGCNWLDPIHKYNEVCCSAHWIYLNQRFHRLFPMQENYSNEIEKSLYNILVANQVGAHHIRYHAFIDIQKDADRSTPVSCCAGLGTRILGSLPEFIFSIADDGLYVNLYTSAEIAWSLDNTPVHLRLESQQPYEGGVKLCLQLPNDLAFKLRLRIPGWTHAAVVIQLNGQTIGEGNCGTYFEIDRLWKDGDCLQFDLPMPIRMSRYHGLDEVRGCERYALEYGPLLLGLVGPLNFMGRYIRLPFNPNDGLSFLEPIENRPAHFAVQGQPDYEYMPYHEIQDQIFSCYPVMG
jgi:uncharacterized protein